MSRGGTAGPAVPGPGANIVSILYSFVMKCTWRLFLDSVPQKGLRYPWQSLGPCIRAVPGHAGMYVVSDFPPYHSDQLCYYILTMYLNLNCGSMIILKYWFYYVLFILSIFFLCLQSCFVCLKNKILMLLLLQINT